MYTYLLYTNYDAAENQYNTHNPIKNYSRPRTRGERNDVTQPVTTYLQYSTTFQLAWSCAWSAWSNYYYVVAPTTSSEFHTGSLS